MKQDEIIEFTKQAGGFSPTPEFLAAFAKLVEEKVTARYMQLFLDPENQPTQFGTATQEYREQEIKDEREACAKVCEEDDSVLNFGQCAAAIRARGEA